MKLTISQAVARKARTLAGDQVTQWARISLLFTPSAVQQTAASPSAVAASMHTCAVEAHLA